MTLPRGVWGLLFVLSACGQPADPPPSKTTGSASGNTPFPCDVGATLQNKCWGCHGSPTQYGAPMTLLTWEDVHKKTRDGQQEIYQRMATRIHSVNDPMPPMNAGVLSPDQLNILDGWIANGAPAGNGCPPPPSGGGGSGGITGGGGTSSTGTGGISYGGYGGTGGTSSTGGATWTGDAGSDVPVEPSPSECEDVYFTARQDASGAPFNVPTGEQYYCFSYHVSSMAGAQGLAFYPKIINTNVIHHWLLYKMGTAQTDGAVNACLGTHPDGELLAGWAFGGGNWFLPSHVGIDMGTGDFILEVHYNNSTGTTQQDSSGVKVCKAVTPRPDVAGISWVGTEAINIPPGAQNFDVPSNCRPTTNQDIHILTTWPHMHKLGVRMLDKIHRSDGTVETLIDKPFSFNNQIQYPTPTVLKPGEWLENHCYYTNDTGSTVNFGESTSAEMCYDFVLAYPANTLVGYNPLAGGSPIQLHSTACNN